MNLSTLSHHATLFVDPNREELSRNIWGDLSAQSPAHIFHNQTVVDIDTAKTLISWANTPYAEEKIALISFHTITLPAQNALLKILEGPRAGVKFILVTSNLEAIIPTLYSRLDHKQVVSTQAHNNVDSVTLFLSAKPSERMKLQLVGDLLGRTDEEGRKDRESVRSFLLSVGLHPSLRANHPKELAEVLEMASFSSLPSSSVKAILEYVSLLLPQTKV